MLLSLNDETTPADAKSAMKSLAGGGGSVEATGVEASTAAAAVTGGATSTCAGAGTFTVDLSEEVVVVVVFGTALGLRARVEAETPPQSERSRPGVATNTAGPEIRSNKAACCLFNERSSVC